MTCTAFNVKGAIWATVQASEYGVPADKYRQLNEVQ